MTYHPKSDFLRVMFERGFVADCTDYQALDEAFKAGIVPGYIGFDATAKSLHVALVAEMRRQADCADGRRDYEGGRPQLSRR